MKKMNILVLGQGGREHSICYAISKSKFLDDLWCIPGNAGTKSIAKYQDLDLNNFSQLISFCQIKKIDLVIPGSEEYLAKGISDKLRLAGINVFGPSKQASKLEASKEYTKQICSVSDINTAKCDVYDTVKAFKSKMHLINNYPVVVKMDGLAAGKGVLIAKSKKEILNFIDQISRGNIGNKNSKILVEEFLEGEEASFFFLTDGKEARFLGSAKDYKRVGENNTGPNTGGMGAISPSPLESKKNIKQISENIIKPTIKSMQKIGYPYVGILYAGLMFTKKGIYLIEYNVRFGDPECQAILYRLKTDFLKILFSLINGSFGKILIRIDNMSSACLVLASKGYPEKYLINKRIHGLDLHIKQKNIKILHAGTKKNKKGFFLTNGGRVLNIVAKHKSIKNSLKAVYELANKIKWQGVFFRKDIGS